MIKRFIETKAALVYKPASLIYDQKRLIIDESISMPSKLTHALNDTTFWFEVDRASLAFVPICKSLGVCESDSATMSTAFASILYFRMVMKEAG